MDANRLKEILYAYSAGCLDREDYAGLFEYINSGSTEFDKEASELQKIITLIPAIVDIEQPHPRTKDKVARKLYRMKDEAKAVREPLVYTPLPVTEVEAHTESPAPEAEPQTPPEYTPLSEVYNDENKQSEDLVNEVHYRDMNEPAAEDESADKPGTSPNIKPAPRPYIPVTEETSEILYKRKSPGSWISFASGVLITVLASAAVFYLLNKEIKKDRAEITALTGQVNALTADLSRLETNQKTQDILRARDISRYNLDGIESNKMGSGEFALSLERKAGVLQLYNMPPLAGTQVYQLWVTTKDTTLPMGVYQTRGEINSFLVDQIPAITADNIVSFKVTLENNPEGAQRPSSNTVLVKMVNNEAGNKGVKK